MGEPKPSSTRVVKQQKTDGNVVLLSLGKLAEEPNLVTGDPLRCGQCEAVLSSTSTLTPQEEDGKKTWTWSVYCIDAVHCLCLAKAGTTFPLSPHSHHNTTTAGRRGLD